MPNTTETTQNQGYSLSYRNDDVYNPILWIIHTKQQSKQTQPKQPKQRHQRGFQHKVCALTTETRQILEYSYSNFNQIQKNSYSTNFVHFIHHQFVHFIDLEKPVRGLMNNFIYFIHPYMNPFPKTWSIITTKSRFLCIK